MFKEFGTRMLKSLKSLIARNKPPSEHELPLHLRTGSAAEKIARQHLEKKGLITVSTNESSRFGEIDIIMLEEKELGDSLVFVEVRFRSQSKFGGPLESINRSKQAKLIKAANFYLSQHPEFSNHFCRFDVVTIEANKNNIQWTPSAFTLEGFRD